MPTEHLKLVVQDHTVRLLDDGQPLVELELDDEALALVKELVNE